MKSNLLKYQLDATADLTLINEVLTLNLNGINFYTNAIPLVDDYNLRRIFLANARIHQKMLARFSSWQPDNAQNAIANNTNALSTIAKNTIAKNVSTEPVTTPATYRLAKDRLHEHQTLAALNALIDIETAVLCRLKYAVKQSQQPLLAQQLAESAAWLQINCDAMASFTGRGQPD